MSKKKGNFLEQHFDKIILGLIGLICLGLLWVYIFRNPYGPTIDGRKESPGSVQARLNQKGSRLREKLDSGPSALTETFPDYISSYQQILACSIPDINPGIYPLTPGLGSQPMELDREYAVPEIPSLQDVQMAHIRGAAYLPTGEVSPETPYSAVETKIGDLDFITVSARLDVKRLVQQFQSCFMGLGVRHKDAALASPVAAKVELQRRTLLDDGTWSEWTPVSFSQTQAYRRQFNRLPLRSEEMPGGGIHVQMAQYNDYLKQMAVLQPPSYDFATSRYQYWMSPPYLKEAQDLIQQQRDEERRLLRESAAGARDTETLGVGGDRTRGGRPTRPTRQQETPRGRDRRTPDMGDPGISPLRPTARQRTVEDVYQDYQKDLISGMDWWNRNEPLLIWAHDDSLQPGETYQYRIRAGFFNPIAGKDWFRADQQEYKDQVVLWSPFAMLQTDRGEAVAVSVPRMLHIFPRDLAKDLPGAVDVKVSKFYMGRWRSQDFQVLPGQVIGSVVEQTQETTLPTAGMADPMMGEMGMGMRGGGMAMAGAAVQTASETIDYTTKYSYLDIMDQVEWFGSVSALRRKEYSSMLYTIDGNEIYKLPIKQQNWPEDLKKAYREVQEAERESEGEVLVGRSSQPGMMQTPGMPGIPGRAMPPRGGPYMGGEGGMMLEY